MTEKRENEIRQMSQDEQKALLFELRQKYSPQHVLPTQPAPMHDAKELVAADEEIEFLEQLLRDSE